MTAEFYKQNRGIEMNSKSNVKKVIGVVSGKGGVEMCIRDRCNGESSR